MNASPAFFSMAKVGGSDCAFDISFTVELCVDRLRFATSLLCDAVR